MNGQDYGEQGFPSSVTEGQRVRQTTASAAEECVATDKYFKTGIYCCSPVSWYIDNSSSDIYYATFGS